MKIEAGKRPYRTRAGHQVRILAIENSPEPVQGQIRGPDGWVSDWWHYSGSYQAEGDHRLDLVGYWEDEAKPDPAPVTDPPPPVDPPINAEPIEESMRHRRWRGGDQPAYFYAEKKSFEAGRPTLVRVCTVPDWPDTNFVCLNPDE